MNKETRQALDAGKCEECQCIPTSLFQVGRRLLCVWCLARLGEAVRPDNCYFNRVHPDYEKTVEDA